MIKMDDNQYYIFAAYLNMAMHNAFIIVRHISQKLNVEPPNLESSLPEAEVLKILKSENSENLVKISKLQELFEKHCPFLIDMTDYKKNKDPKFDGNVSSLYYEKLTRIFEQLEKYRNYYTHTKHKEIKQNIDLIKDLEITFDFAVNEVKKRFSHKVNTVEHLRRKDNRGRKKKDFIYSFLDKSGEKITDKGLEFLICLFLRKEYAYLFLRKFRGFKCSETLSEQATLEAYTIRRVLVPNERIETKHDSFTLSLDMLNELAKCPAPLFSHLCEKDREIFRICAKSDRDDKNIKDTKISDNGESLLKRKSDRFPFFALCYLDFTEAFEKLRFHIDLGVYKFRFYEKVTVNGEKNLRVISKNLRGFGRLKEIIDERKKVWKDIVRNKSAFEIDDTNTEPYVSDTYPHYHFVNNSIGLKSCEGEGLFLPDLNGKETSLKAPDFILSVYELPALIFYCYLRNTLHGKKSKSPEEIIMEYRDTLLLDFKERISKFFKDISDGKLRPINKTGGKEKRDLLKAQLQEEYSLKLNAIPRQIRDYLLGIERLNFDKYAQNKLDSLIDETKKLKLSFIKKIERLSDKGNKPGKKGYVEIKSGVLADFLAKDMLYFQPAAESEDGGKVTSLNYQVLQAALAQFAANRSELRGIFKNCGLIQSEYPHPFLLEISDTSKTNYKDFYSMYLDARLAYLEKCRESKSYNEYSFLKPGRSKWKEKNGEYYKALIESYFETPLNLPRGLFHKPLLKLFEENNNSFKGFHWRISKQTSRINTSFLIQKYFEIVLEDSNQKFYDFNRTYQFINKLFDNRNDNEKSKSLHELYYSTEEIISEITQIKAKIREKPAHDSDGGNPREKFKRMFNKFTQNEKIIRLYKVQDILMFLTGKELLKINFPDGLQGIENVKLKDLKFKSEGEKNVLNQEVNYQFKHYGKTFTATIKLKKFGDFIWLLHDRRIKEMVKWVIKQKIEITLEELKNELDNYERYRVKAFEIIHDFEKAVFKRAESALKWKETGYIAFDEFIKTSIRLLPKFQKSLERIKTIRDNFAHNKYPDEPKDILSKEELPEISEIAKSIYSILDEDVESFKKKLGIEG